MSLLKNTVWSPIDYAKASVLASEVGEEMLGRLEWMTLKPRVILDLGCGTGELSGRLQERYQEAHVVSLDLSESMISHAKQKDIKLTCVCADAASLPFQNQSVDLIFANLLLPWQENIELLLRECKRVLRPEGLLMLTSLGPDTLQKWRGVIQQELVPVFIDMHDIGDLMLKLKLADPVLDVNYYTLTYRHQKTLFEELQATGMLRSIPELAEEVIPDADGKWDAVYEVIFTHAFLPAESENIGEMEDGIARIPLSHLRRQLR